MTMPKPDCSLFIIDAALEKNKIVDGRFKSVLQFALQRFYVNSLRNKISPKRPCTGKINKGTLSEGELLLGKELQNQMVTLNKISILIIDR